MFHQERQHAIEFLYQMLEGHRHQTQLHFLNQITDTTSVADIDALGEQAYDLPMEGLKDISRATAERYIRRFGGVLTGVINDPMSYPTLIDRFGDEIGIVMGLE